MLATSSRVAFSRVLLASPVLALRPFASLLVAPRRLAQDSRSRDALSLHEKRRTRATAIVASGSSNDQSKASSTMTSSPPTIGTHNGSFHCDEALGVALLRRTAAYADAKVVRSRKQEVLDKCDAVIDVGGVYDAASNRFDHHQKEFNDVFGHGKSGFSLFFRPPPLLLPERFLFVFGWPGERVLRGSLVTKLVLLLPLTPSAFFSCFL